MGGTLMNESISHAAGATHGQEMNVDTTRTATDDLLWRGSGPPRSVDCLGINFRLTLFPLLTSTAKFG